MNINAIFKKKSIVWFFEKITIILKLDFFYSFCTFGKFDVNEGNNILKVIFKLTFNIKTDIDLFSSS